LIQADGQFSAGTVVPGGSHGSGIGTWACATQQYVKKERKRSNFFDIKIRSFSNTRKG
jgi:hypothetical protein